MARILACDVAGTDEKPEEEGILIFRLAEGRCEMIATIFYFLFFGTKLAVVAEVLAPKCDSFAPDALLNMKRPPEQSREETVCGKRFVKTPMKQVGLKIVAGGPIAADGIIFCGPSVPNQSLVYERPAPFLLPSIWARVDRVSPAAKEEIKETLRSEEQLIF